MQSNGFTINVDFCGGEPSRINLYLFFLKFITHQFHHYTNYFDYNYQACKVSSQSDINILGLLARSSTNGTCPG